jgi:putative NIF3 family GTP cyclohydrolase 1 type 2
MEKEDFVALVKETFDVDCVRYNSWTGETVKRVALCGGAGSFLIPKAIASGVDAFITGEIGYHKFFGFEDQLLLMELGHYESEQFTLEILRDVIKKAAPEMQVLNTTIDTNPINYL